MQNDEIVRHMIDLQLDRLLSPGVENDELPLRSIRQDCGSWLALRRAALGLSDAMIAERTGLTPLQIRLLEQGLFASARDAMLEGAWQVLAVLLENEQHDFARVKAIIRLALGRAEADDAKELPRVAADLAALEKIADPLAQSAAAADYATEETKLEDLPEVSQVVVALTNGATTALAIQDEIRDRTHQDPIPLATIASVLTYLDHRSIIGQGTMPSAAIVQQPRFHLTLKGLQVAIQAVRLEDQRVALEKQRAALDEQRAQQRLIYQQAQQSFKNALLAPAPALFS